MSVCDLRDVTLAGQVNVTSSIPRTTPSAARDLRVPRYDGAWMQLPAPLAAAALLQNNAREFASVDMVFEGRPLQDWRKQVQREVHQAAVAFTAQWRSVPAGTAVPSAWIVGGHQPALFHPGVWAKNFAMGRLASDLHAVSLNLVVDNDTLSSQSIRVPTGTARQPTIVKIPFDSATYQQPWEDIRVQDQGLFDSFAERVIEQLRPWGYRPLLADYWQDVRQQTAALGRVADGFTAARNLWEAKWGLENLELPISQLCELPSFLWFTAHLLRELPRFTQVYNSAVHAYRIRNKIHSTSHPVPNLTVSGDWHEAPFWIWRAGDRRRSKLFARVTAAGLELSMDGIQPLTEMSVTPAGDTQKLVDVLQALQAAGLHIRTRALTTTLFSRVFLADMFVHGIGGSKYDEITDVLIAEFWGLPVPHYWTVSGTLHLPLDVRPATVADLHQAQSELWDLRWNPARALGRSGNPEVQALVTEFHDALELHSTDAGPRRGRHAALHAIKSRLRPWTAEPIQATQQRLRDIQQELATNHILQDREYAAVLYPEDKLRTFLTHTE